MILAQWLLDAAVLHSKAKDKFEDHVNDCLCEDKATRRLRRKVDFTDCDDEMDLNASVVAALKKPKEFKKLSATAVLALAYFFKETINGDRDVKGIEVVRRLRVSDDRSVTYLSALDELKNEGWINLYPDLDYDFIAEAPYCWLHAQLELGDSFIEAASTDSAARVGFESNDTYLEAMFGYLDGIVSRESRKIKFSDAHRDPSFVPPDAKLRKINRRAEISKADLTAHKVVKQFRMSFYQHLTLVGMLGQKEDELQHDFSDPNDVICLFASGRSAKQKMRQHLYGADSPLMRHRMIESRQADFGTQFSLTSEGVKVLTGKKLKGKAKKLLMEQLKKQTIFDIEVPTVKPGSVLLPAAIEEAIESMLFSETKEGYRLRREWYKSLPSEWGAPIGTTVLLYGPAGTGKTLTAQYLASRLKRPLLKVDSAQVLSMWVGQSEQKVRQIFEQYEEVRSSLGIAPVLLFNEADQLLGTRGGGEHSVDKMYNNMQNLFLEGMERFKGVLVATTNRRDLLDAAFSRRFTYKLELPQPDAALRRAIWERHLPLDRLGEDCDLSLLAKYNLSGGEIRLVVEKAVREAAHAGRRVIGHNALLRLAAEEERALAARGGENRLIGFDGANI